MRNFLAGLLVVVAAAAVGQATVWMLDHPPHAEPAAARVITPGVMYEPGLEVQHEIGRIEHDEHQARLAAQAQAEAEAMAAAQRPRTTGSTPTRDLGPECAALSAQMNLPAEILYRESRCTWAYNPTGCGGRGCLGPAQLDAGHFNDTSPWNPNASGSCAGLNPEVEADYVQCVDRLSAGGTNLRPWAF